MKVSTDRFSFKGKLFYTEMSSLGLNFFFESVGVKLGLVLVSSKTGNNTKFEMVKVYRDAEGKIQKWELRCITPNFEYLKMVIFND